MKKLILIVICLIPLCLWGQQEVEIGGFAGFANYQGDLTPEPVELSETKLSLGGFVRYHLNPKIKIRLNAYFGTISGSDFNDNDGSLASRGWSFKSNIFEFGLMGEYHPFGKSRQGMTGVFRRQISPFVYTGIGLVHSSPKITTSNPEDEGLFPEKDFTPLNLSIPVGGGIRADLFEFVSLGVEGGLRYTNNDYLDGVKYNGNPDGKDFYLFAGATLSFYLGSIEGFQF